MKRRIRGSTPEVEAAAREMRKKPTPAEAALWEALRGKKVRGLRFREQHAIGRFVFDFYCAACKLVIEVDGEYHDDPDQQDRDKARTEYLNAGGYTVLRFRNEDILNNLPLVIARIEAALPR